jgi:hypothetical protein
VDDFLLHPPFLASTTPPERLTVGRAGAFAFERDETAKKASNARGVI